MEIDHIIKEESVFNYITELPLVKYLWKIHFYVGIWAWSEEQRVM